MNIHQEINLKLWKISAESKEVKIPQTWKPDKTTDYSEKLRSFAAVSVILSQLFKSIHSVIAYLTLWGLTIVKSGFRKDIF